MAIEPEPRERGAGEVNERLSSCSSAEAAALATLLAAAAAVEEERGALEAQLQAILELTSTPHIGPGHIAQLHEPDLEGLPSQVLREYVTDLLDG